MRKELLAKQKKDVYRMWEKGQATWEAYRNVDRVCRGVARKAKVHLELDLARDVKENSFCKYIGSKKKTRENVSPLLDEVGALLSKDREKAE